MMIRRISTLMIALLASCHLSSAGEDGDRFEKRGWTKLRSLESAPVKLETGSEEPVSMFVIDEPGISLPKHLVAGELRYSGVEGSGFIEMWTSYDNGQRYFTRTMGETGSMAKLSGDSDWRPVTLPFHGKEGELPTKLEINVVLPGGGEVELRGLALYQSEQMRGVGNGSWDMRSFNKIGGFGGALIGVLGGICGVLSGMGKARRFVQGFLVVLLIGGAALAISGVIALVSGQQRELWMPMLVLGGIMACAGGLCFQVVRRAYTQHELRRISAAG